MEEMACFQLYKDLKQVETKKKNNNPRNETKSWSLDGIPVSLLKAALEIWKNCRWDFSATLFIWPGHGL